MTMSSILMVVKRRGVRRRRIMWESATEIDMFKVVFIQMKEGSMD